MLVDEIQFLAEAVDMRFTFEALNKLSNVTLADIKDQLIAYYASNGKELPANYLKD